MWVSIATAAAIYTLIETAKLKELDPLAWPSDVLARLHDHQARHIDQLLPWNWKATQRQLIDVLLPGGSEALANALLAEVAKTADRVVLIEDTRELQCRVPNLVAELADP